MEPKRRTTKKGQPAAQPAIVFADRQYGFFEEVGFDP